MKTATSDADVPRKRETNDGRFPRLTVVMPNYNDAAFVAEALTAVADQIAGHGKILFVDDGSKDDSVAIARQVLAGRDDAEVRINSRNQGVIRTLNAALENVDTPYVYFAASNDRVEPGFFRAALDFFAQHPEAPLYSGLVRYMTPEGAPRRAMRVPLPLRQTGFLTPTQVARELRRGGQWIVGAGTIFATEALRAIGGFDPALYGATDSVAAMCLALKQGAGFAPRIASNWRMDDASFAKVSLQDWQTVERTIAAGMRQLASIAGHSRYPDMWRREQLYWYFRNATKAGKRRQARAHVGSVMRLNIFSRLLLSLPLPGLLQPLGALAIAPFKIPQFLRKNGQWLAFHMRAAPGDDTGLPD